MQEKIIILKLVLRKLLLILLIFTKDTSPTMKGLLKAASCHMKEFPKAGEVDNFTRISSFNFRVFQNMFIGLLSAFGEPFVG
jgi:hypothetical protein